MRASQTLGILILAGVLVVSVPEFTRAQDPTPTPTPIDAMYTWKNTGTDFNTGGNWTPTGGPPKAGDVGAFSGAEVTQPNLSASDTISGLYFKGTGASGYDLTRTNSSTLTLTATNALIGSENGNNNQTVAIGAENTSGTNTIDVPIILGAASGTQTFIQAAGGTLVINGVISNTNNITLSLTGGGTVTLAGANTYTGGTSVTGGTTLLVNNTSGSGTGTGAVTVNGSGTTLGGTGTISGTVTLGGTTPGAILNPGPKGTAGTSASVGTLTTGALTLTGANTVHIDAFGTATNQWDQLISTGAISLGTTSTLQVIIASGLTFTAGETYVLLTGTSLTGTFSGIANNQLVTFTGGYEFIAEYTSTGFDLVAVPEPGTWCAAALALGVIGYSQRRRFSRLLKLA